MIGSRPTRWYFAAIGAATTLIIAYPALFAAMNVWLQPDAPGLAEGFMQASMAMAFAIGGTLLFLAAVSPFVAVLALVYVALDATVTPKRRKPPKPSNPSPDGDSSPEGIVREII